MRYSNQGQDQVKISLRSPDMLADVAIVDPTLPHGTNLYLSGRGAMDAFTHLMEAYVCGDPNPLTDMICEEGLRKLSGFGGDKRVFKMSLKHDQIWRLLPCWVVWLLPMPSLGAAHGLASALGGKISCSAQYYYGAFSAICDAREY